MGIDEKEFQAMLAADPGDPAFASYADWLRIDGRSAEALEICLKGLSANPACHAGRLVLANIFYSLGYVPFAKREIVELLRDLPECKALKSLAAKFQIFGNSQIAAEEITISESDFGIDALGELEEPEQ